MGASTTANNLAAHSHPGSCCVAIGLGGGSQLRTLHCRPGANPNAAQHHAESWGALRTVFQKLTTPAQRDAHHSCSQLLGQDQPSGPTTTRALEAALPGAAKTKGSKDCQQRRMCCGPGSSDTLTLAAPSCEEGP